MIQKSTFGRTGHESTRVIFGACALWNASRAEADRTLDQVLEHGINHIDTAASYQKSEQRLGPWLKHHRREFFLATKTGERSAKEAREELHRSLELLQTDHIDLWQIHCLIEPDEWDEAMGPGGVLEAFIEAREQGLVRYLGVTGHGVQAPAFHLKSLERFDFDSVLLPCNYMMLQNPDYAAGFNRLLEVCRPRDVAVQTIKSIARGELGDKEKKYGMWYDPLDDADAIDRAVRWVLAKEQVFLNSPADMTLLPHVIAAAENGSGSPSDEEMEADIVHYGLTPLFK